MPSMSSTVTSSMGEVKEGNSTVNNLDEPCTVVEDEECGKDLRALDTFVSDVSREEEENPDTNPKSTKCHSVWSCITAFFNTYSFMIYAAAGIILAYSYPPLGAVYVYPKITSSYVAVITIFLLSGIGLRTKELKNVYKNINFNIFVVVFNFGVVSAIVFGIAKFLLTVGALSEALAQGLIICGCLALTVNMVFILTAKAGGDEALGIFHAAFVSYAFNSVVELVSEDNSQLIYTFSFHNKHVAITGKLYWRVPISIIGPILYW